MQIKSVAVLGAGAVGAYVIWGLSSRKDIRLAVIAEGPRAERLKQQGITINGTTYRPQVWTPQEANGVDLLVVALKYGALPGALDSIAAAVGPNTTVMSLMNGVDSEEIIAAKIGAEHVLPSLIKVASHKEADGYHFNPRNHHRHYLWRACRTAEKRARAGGGSIACRYGHSFPRYPVY